MPTGYTHDLYAGNEQTFSEFALQCARAFGATIMQRDESPDVPPRLRQEGAWYSESLDKAKARLAEVEAWDDNDWQRETRLSNDATRRARAEDAAKREGIRERYEAMLTEVLAWDPPTPEHVGLRDFMAEQLRESIKFDCGELSDYYRMQTVEEFREATLARARRDVEHRTEDLRKERERVEQANAWIVSLYASLDLPAPERAA